MFLRIDMMARGSKRGASTSPLEAIASAVSVIAEDFPSLSTLTSERHVVTAVIARRCRLLSLDLTLNVQRRNASALLDFPDFTGVPFLLPRAPTTPPRRFSAAWRSRRPHCARAVSTGHVGGAWR